MDKVELSGIRSELLMFDFFFKQMLKTIENIITVMDNKLPKTEPIVIGIHDSINEEI